MMRSSSHCQSILQIRNTIPMSDLDGVKCLPGDRGQEDKILLIVDDDMNDCFTDTYVGIRLQLSEFIDEWKGVVSTLVFLQYKFHCFSLVIEYVGVHIWVHIRLSKFVNDHEWKEVLLKYYNTLEKRF